MIVSFLFYSFEITLIFIASRNKITINTRFVIVSSNAMVEIRQGQ